MTTTQDFQLGMKLEDTVGTPETVDRFFEFKSETLRPDYGVLTSNNRRKGQAAVRADRTVRTGLRTLTGGITHDPLSKGWGLIPKLVFGTVSTGSPSETTDYLHTFSITAGNLTGIAATIQVGRPWMDGTVQPFTYAGCKGGGLTLSTGIDGILESTLSIAHASAESVSGSVESASYPSGAQLFSYVGGSLLVDTVATPISNASVSITNAFAKRPKQGNPAGLEPLENGDRAVSASFTAEFTSMTLLNKVRSATASGGQAAIVMKWQAPTLLSATLYPYISVTIPVLDVLGDYVAVNGPDLIMLPLNGIARVDGSGVLCTLGYQTTDSAP